MFLVMLSPLNTVGKEVESLSFKCAATAERIRSKRLFSSSIAHCQIKKLVITRYQRSPSILEGRFDDTFTDEGKSATVVVVRQ